MGLFDLFKKKMSIQGDDKKHFNYVFIVRREAGVLPCDTEYGWEGILKMCQNASIFKKAKIVHPRDWDDEPYGDTLFKLNSNVLHTCIKVPNANININFSDVLACENDLSKRSGDSEQLKFSCFNLLASGVSKYIMRPDMTTQDRNVFFDDVMKFSSKKGMFIMRFEDGKLEVADGNNMNLDICEGIAFLHITGKRPE